MGCPHPTPERRALAIMLYSQQDGCNHKMAAVNKKKKNKKNKNKRLRTGMFDDPLMACLPKADARIDGSDNNLERSAITWKGYSLIDKRAGPVLCQPDNHCGEVGRFHCLGRLRVAVGIPYPHPLRRP